MRIPFFATLVLAFGLSTYAQEPAPQSLAEISAQLQQLSASLRQTQAELHDAQAEIRSLRTELQQARGATPSGTPKTAVDDRIADLEESQRITDSRLEQQQQTKVESVSKYNVRLSGMVLFNAGMNRGAVDNQDVPMLATPLRPGSSGGNIFGGMRQSLLGLQLSGPRLAGARTTAEVQFDFFAGAPNTEDGTAMGIMRLRTARAQFDWENWSLMFGQDKPFISPLSPSSLATLGTPGFGYSGNLWTWTPQIVATRRWKPTARDTMELQFGILDPFNGQEPRTFQIARYPEPGEQTRMPALAVHPTWRRGDEDHPFSIGAGAYFAKQDYGFHRIVNAWAATLDWSLPITSMFSVSGELFRGRALGGLWGGIGQSVSFGGDPALASTPAQGINTLGGWSQLKLKPNARWEFNGAFGEDSPFADDIRYGFADSYGNYARVLRNWTTMVNVIQRPRSNLLLSLEYRHLNTVQLDGSARTAEHINLGVGLQF